MVVTDDQVDTLHPLLEQLVAAELALVGVLVHVVGGAHVIEEPREEVVRVPRQVVVVVFTDVGRLELLDLSFHLVELVHDRLAGLGRPRVALAALREEFTLAGLQLLDLRLGLDEFAGRVSEGLTLLVVDVDVAHRGLPFKYDRPDRLRASDRACVLDELAHLLVDVRRDDDRSVVLAGVFERGHERREGLPRPRRALEQHVLTPVQRVGDPVHRLALVRVRLLVREEP